MMVVYTRLSDMDLATPSEAARRAATRKAAAANQSEQPDLFGMVG